MKSQESIITKIIRKNIGVMLVVIGLMYFVGGIVIIPLFRELQIIVDDQKTSYLSIAVVDNVEKTIYLYIVDGLFILTSGILRLFGTKKSSNLEFIFIIFACSILISLKIIILNSLHTLRTQYLMEIEVLQNSFYISKHIFEFILVGVLLLFVIAYLLLSAIDKKKYTPKTVTQ
jgi:amino acid transporter